MEADDDGVGGLEAAQARCQQFYFPLDRYG